MALKVIILSLLLSFSVNAAEDFSGRKLPKLEAGIATGYFYVPDYPGADQSQSRFLPLPYFIYRGEIFRADREGGLRGRVFNNETIEFDVSLGAAFSVSGDSNSAREGMPRLDWMGEIGPKLVVHLVKTPIIALDFGLPVRSVFTTANWSVDHRGYVAEPFLKFRHRALFNPTISFFATASLMFADEELMDYFYEVKPAFATANRPAYNAKAGYMGSGLSVSMVKAFFKQNAFLFMGIKNDYYSGSENIDSPLLKDNTTQSYFVGLAWGFYKSKEAEVKPE